MPVKPTFHQQARRDQLVDVAVEIIGESGLAAASVSAVARRTGTSRGVVTYNVGDRDQLMALVVARAYQVGEQEVGPAVRSAGDPAQALRAFASASLDFYAAHPALMRALREIFADRDLVDRAVTREFRREVDDLSALLHEGQRQGRFGPFDVPMTVAVIRAALDHAAATVADSGVDDQLRNEVVALVDRLTRRS